jgi:hypothetical protein
METRIKVTSSFSTAKVKCILVLSLVLCYVQSVSSRSHQHYALFFAVNSYEHMDDLQNPIRNANEIATELKSHFNFQAEVVENPTIDDIDSKLDEYERKFNDGTFSQQGQLFIYFSGHGISVNNNGYFMSADASPERPQRTAMEYDFYRNKIDGFACQHIMVVIDACHSAAFDPQFGSRSNRGFDRPGEQTFDRIMANHEKYYSRVFWTSDAVGKETPDRSNFAYELLEGLRTYQNSRAYIRSSELYALYLEEANPKAGGGHFGKDEPNSCFLFFRQGDKKIVALDEQGLWLQVKNQDSERAYASYLESYPDGRFTTEAKNAIKRLQGIGAKPARNWIFDEIIAPSYEIGLNTELGDKYWMSKFDDYDYYRLAYRGNQRWGVFFFSVGDAYPDSQKNLRKAQDFSGYSTLMVDMRSEKEGTIVEIGMKDKNDLNNGAETKISVRLTTEWETYSFKLTDFKTADMEIIHIPIEFVFGKEAANVDFRNIWFN